MTIYVFSDTHGETARMAELCRAGKPDIVLHAGDFARDIAVLRGICPAYAVLGNSDGYNTAGTTERVMEFDGVKIYITHGHSRIAPPSGTRVVITGHTHVASCREYEGVLYLNPGSPSRPRAGRAGYAVLTITEGQVSAELKSL